MPSYFHFSTGFRLFIDAVALTLTNEISINPDVMGGKPCIRGMRVTVGMIVEALAAGRSVGDLLADFPYLEERDIRKAPAYASGLAQGRNLRSPADAAALGHEPDRHVGSAVT